MDDSLWRVRQGFVKAGPARAYQTRGQAREYGLMVPQGVVSIAQRLPPLIEEVGIWLPRSLWRLIHWSPYQLKPAQLRVDKIEGQIKTRHPASEVCRRRTHDEPAYKHLLIHARKLHSD